MIYLDHHAATPLAAGVAEAMAEAHSLGWANPSSVHAAGRNARRLVENARGKVARVLGAEPADVVFTGGGSEACNLAVRGLAPGVAHVVTTEIEHPAVAAAVARLQDRGTPVSRLPLPGGRPPAPSALAQLLSGRGPALVAVQWVNHETGTLLPVSEYAEVCARHGALLVVDACQALGKLPLRVEGLAALAVAGAKVGAPAGAAALWVKRGLPLAPLLDGGAQERGRRAGTPDVAALVGFGVACEGLPGRLADQPRVAGLRDRLEGRLSQLGAKVNAAEGPRVATVTNLSVPGWRGDMLVAALDVEGLCASSGAACSSGVGEPSPVLRAMYPDQPWRAESALRLSLGPETGPEAVDGACAIAERVLARAGDA